MEDLVCHIGTLISWRLVARPNLRALDRRRAEIDGRPARIRVRL